MQQRLDEAKMQKSMWTMLMGKPLDLEKQENARKHGFELSSDAFNHHEKNEKC